MFYKMPFILLLLIVAIISCNHFIPLNIKEVILALSLMIKELIVFVLPFIIFALLFKTAISLAKNATKLIIVLLFAICLSNLISTNLSRFFGEIVYNFDLSLIIPSDDIQGLKPSFLFKLHSILPNNIAMFAGLIFGCIFGYLCPTKAESYSKYLDKFMTKVLSIIIVVIPIFMAGFVVKLAHDEIIVHIIKNYSAIFAIIMVGQFSYIFFVYCLANNFSLRRTIISIKNMLPAAIAGFSTMSSASAMPLTIIGVEKNSAEPDFARSVIPATVNVHLVGDCFAIPILAYAILKSYGMAEPTLLNYLIFSFYFVLAKFSVAAIPGGGIIVMIPILESCLGFNSGMSALITALYILFDPIITSANVLGNGAFACYLSKLRTKKES